MADVNPLSMINAVLAGMGSDTKGRMDSDLSEELFKSGANFTDVMMARVTARQHSSDDLQDIQKDYSDSSSKPEWVDQLKYAKADDTRRDDKETTVSTDKADKVADKPRSGKADKASKTTSSSSASVASTASEDTEWSDDRAVSGLKKMANTMLEAEKEGKITLPAEIKQILEKIAAAGDTPGQILPLVQDMLGVLRKLDLKVSDTDLKSPLGDMTWPAEITDIFKDLQVNPGAKTDQPVDLGKLIKALRTLGNLVQQHAISKADKQALIDAAVVVAGEKKVVDSFKAPEKDKLEVLDSDKTDTTEIPSKKMVDVVMNAMPTTAVPAADKPTGNSTLPSVGKSDDKDARSDDLIAGMAKGARQDRNPAMGGGGGHNDAAARNGAASGGGSAMGGSASSPLSLQFENQPALTPVAAAMSARSSFTSAVTQAAAGNNGTAPHPATQQVIVSLQKSAITKDTSLSIQLNPAELGRVDVKITIDQNGKASAQVIADRPETLSMLQKDSSHLEKALQNAGLNSSAQDLHYSLREQNSQQRGQEFAGQKRRRALFDTDEGSQKVSMDAPLAADGLPHRVNYHA